MPVAHAGKGLELRAQEDSRVMFIGGEPLRERIVW